MSLLASLFGARPAEPASATPTNTPPATPAPPVTAGGEPAGDTANTGEPAKDDYIQSIADMLAGKTNKEDGEGASPTLSMNLTPEILAKASQTVNFMQGITEEQLQAATSGDMQALLGIIQQTSRTGYERALQDSLSVAGMYSDQRAELAAQQAAKGIRSQVIESQVDVENLSPAAQTMFRTVASQVANSNPTASAQEVKRLTTEMFQELAKEFDFSGRSMKQQSELAAKASTIDWSQAFGQPNQ